MQACKLQKATEALTALREVHTYDICALFLCKSIRHRFGFYTLFLPFFVRLEAARSAVGAACVHGQPAVQALGEPKKRGVGGRL